MPNKHFYFAIGAVHGVVAVWFVHRTRHWLYRRTAWMRRLYRWDRDWFLYFPIPVGAAGLWGLIPDFLHAFGLLPKAVTRGDFFNVFFFHSFFERVEDTHPRLDWWLNLIGSTMLLSVSLGIVCFYAREAHLSGKGEE